MAKIKSVYFCSACGYESAKWLGKCPGCGEWNTFTEEKVNVSARKGAPRGLVKSSLPVRLSDIEVTGEQRIKMPSAELNRVLGGGLVSGSLILIGGEPGIGKSTLLLQNILSIRNRKILYISGEESASQLRIRADRLGKVSDNTLILCETQLDAIFAQIENVKPELVVVDSIQTILNPELESAPGSVSQVRECAAALLRFAKESDVPVILVGHINKDGAIAGPKVLEHIVDTVLQFEGDRQYLYRILRAIKNRFGSTNEIGVFEMEDVGLTEVPNPSEAMLAGRPTDAPGTCVTCVMEGVRPVLAEIQALLAPTSYGNARRSSNGFDFGRAAMLLAVLEKRGGLKVSACDAYMNIIGGLTLDEPAADLAAVLALASSYLDRPVAADLAAIGEVGLTGELRAVNNLDQRLSEVCRLGFKTCIVPLRRGKKPTPQEGLRVIEAANIGEAIRAALGK